MSEPAKKRRTRPNIVQIMPTTTYTEGWSGYFPCSVPHASVAALDDRGRVWVRSLDGAIEWTLLPKLPLE
jgi:hypothetical protein